MGVFPSRGICEDIGCQHSGGGVGCYLRRDTKRVKMLEINNATLRTTLKVSSYNVHAEGLLYGLLYIHYRTDYHKDC